MGREVGEGARPIGNGFYARSGVPGVPPIRPAEHKLNVPVAALIGPANRSATFGFINAAKASGKVRMFGEQTGANRRGLMVVLSFYKTGGQRHRGSTCHFSVTSR